MSWLARLASKRRTVLEHLNSEVLSPLEKATFVLDSSLSSMGLGKKIAVDINYVLELTRPPNLFRGLRDLVIRQASVADGEKLCRIDQTDAALVRQRFERHDRCYVGEIGGEVLCMVWLHRGPTPFQEDEPLLGRWALGADTVWSYHAVAVPEARQTGVFVKVFQRALIDALAEPGVVRVLCRIKHTNLSSLTLHERMGFRRLGRLLSVRTPLGRWLHWQGPSARSLPSSPSDAPELDFLV